MKIQKLTDVGSAPHEVEPYLVDPSWVMQQKFDGARVMLVHDGQTFSWNGNGEVPIAFSAALLRLPALEAELSAVLPDLNDLRDSEGILRMDGELIIESGTFYVFDILQDPSAPLRDRLELLGRLSWENQTLIQPVRTYRDEDAKRRFWAEVNGAGVEGAVSKHLDSQYLAGQRSKFWLKHKLVKSCECVVTKASRVFKDNGVVSHGSADLAVFTASGDLLPIASASLIGKELTIEVGSVVEVNYLYRQDGGALVQPRINRQRFDREPADCVESQIPAYTRRTVHA